MESYKKHIATNPKVELVHVSYDNEDKAAADWAKKEGFPWPTVLRSQAEASGLEAFAGDFVPEYVLLDKDGKVLARGKDEAFVKIAALK